jgi:hypothetical protein
MAFQIRRGSDADFAFKANRAQLFFPFESYRHIKLQCLLCGRMKGRPWITLK